MILQQTDPIILIRQTDHAFLSGFFAREWGNGNFSRPEPFNSFCLAVAEHDNGWQEWELAPGVDPKTFTPFSFMTVPTEEHISLYQRGIDRILKADLYAGLLVVSHCMGLYDRARATIPGYSSKYVKTQEQHVANDFVQRLRLQQLRLKVDLRNDPATKAFTDEKLIKANVQRLEALDRLSLLLPRRRRRRLDRRRAGKRRRKRGGLGNSPGRTQPVHTQSLSFPPRSVGARHPGAPHSQTPLRRRRGTPRGPRVSLVLQHPVYASFPLCAELHPRRRVSAEHTRRKSTRPGCDRTAVTTLENRRLCSRARKRPCRQRLVS